MNLVLFKHLYPLYLQFMEIIHGCYPSFVWRKRPICIGDTLPVFCFHTVTAESFEAQLKFLKENEYKTLTSEQAYDILFKQKQIPERMVLLTFDDARKSTWSIVYPLLKKYKFSATVFMVPGLVRGSECLMPNLEDVWNGRESLDVFRNIDTAEHPFISWQEAEEMHDSGIIDFQFHSLYHRKIPVASKIKDFMAPEQISSFFYDFDVPYMKDEDNYYELNKILGAPIYQSGYFFSDFRMYCEDIDLRNNCIEFVKNKGGEEFFKKRNCKSDMRKNAEKFLKDKNKDDCFESEGEQRKRILESLFDGIKIMERRLPGKKVEHFAFPWGCGSKVSVELSREAGFKTNYWSSIYGKANNSPHNNPYEMVRLKHDFIWRLPGQGRKSLAEIFLFKFFRRFSGNIDY